VATTRIEFFFIVIVPSQLQLAYREFTNLVRKEHLHWLLNPNSNDYDNTLSRMPCYKSNDKSWRYAKDEGTVICLLGIMMTLHDLRKEQGTPLPPSDGLIPRVVSMWNVGKGPIDDMRQVLATCLTSFGPINGMCWILIRTWTMMLFNAWRLNAISASSEVVLSDRCVTRKKFLAARTYHGKSFVEFLNTLYDSMEMSEIVRGGQSSAIDDAMSPQRPGTERKSYV
jgi:hypothetical protein